MNDSELMRLFQEGSAPERDESFARAVAGDIRQVRILARLVRCIQLSLCAGIVLGCYFLSTLLTPVFVQLSSSIAASLTSPAVHALAAIVLIVAAFLRRPAY